jgi:hypothetical protein
MAFSYQKPTPGPKKAKNTRVLKIASNSIFDSTSSAIFKKSDAKPTHPLKKLTVFRKAFAALKKNKKIQKFVRTRLKAKYSAFRKWEWHLNSSKYLLTLEETSCLKEELKDINSTQKGVKIYAKNVEIELGKLNSSRRNDLEIILKGSVLTLSRAV